MPTGEIELFFEMDVQSLSYTSFEFFINLFVFLTWKKHTYPISRSTSKVEIPEKTDLETLDSTSKKFFVDKSMFIMLQNSREPISGDFHFLGENSGFF